MQEGSYDVTASEARTAHSDESSSTPSPTKSPLKRWAVVVAKICLAICVTGSGTLAYLGFAWSNEIHNASHHQKNASETNDIIPLVQYPFKVADYDFPSVDERFEYYMGGWYNKTLPNLEIEDCPAFGMANISMGNTDNIISLEALKEYINNTPPSTLTRYCTNARDTLQYGKDAKKGNARLFAMFHFGDTHYSISNGKVPLPSISKSRLALSENSDNVPIIWPLNMPRHYRDVDSYHSEISNEVPWKKKLPRVFWRGVTTGERHRLLDRWIQYDRDVIDIALTEVVVKRDGSGSVGAEGGIGLSFYRNHLAKHHVRNKETVIHMAKYKYLLSVEGNDVATGLKWMLYSNSVVLMSPPKYASWAMEDLLLPFVHYIPLNSDFCQIYWK